MWMMITVQKLSTEYTQLLGAWHVIGKLFNGNKSISKKISESEVVLFFFRLYLQMEKGYFIRNSKIVFLWNVTILLI